MFDYLVNKYNPSPVMTPQERLEKNYLYVEYAKAPYLVLPDTLEDFRALHKRKFWYKLRRYERQYEDSFGELNFKIVTEKKELIIFLDQVFELFNNRWSKEYTSAAWKHKEGFEEYKRAMIDLCNSNKAFLAVLFDKHKKLLSYGYCLDQNETIYFYQHTTSVDEKYRRFSLGKVLIHHLLRYAIKRKYHKFDFMAGNSPYKYEWTKSAKTIYVCVGKKSISNLLKMYLLKIRYAVQFNQYSRRVLKIIFRYGEGTWKALN